MINILVAQKKLLLKKAFKIALKITLGIMLFFTTLWIIMAISLRFIFNIDELIYNKSPIPIIYTNYTIEYLLVPKIILNNVKFHEFRAEKAKITLSLKSFFKASPQIATISVFNGLFDASDLITNKGIKDAMTYRSKIAEIIYDTCDIRLYLHNTLLIMLDKQIAIETLHLISDQNNFVLRSAESKDFNLNIAINKGLQSILCATFANSDLHLSIEEKYKDKQYQSSQITYKSLKAKDQITATINQINPNNSAIILTGTINGAANIDYSNNNLLAGVKFTDVMIDDYNLLSPVIKIIDQNHKITDSAEMLNFDNLNIEVDIDNLVLQKQLMNNLHLAISKNNNNQIIVDDLSGDFAQATDSDIRSVGQFKVQAILLNNAYNYNLKGNLSISHQNTNDLLRNFGLADNDSSVFENNFSASSKWSVNNAQFKLSELNCDIAQGKLKGSASFKFNNLNNHIKLDLQGNNLDLLAIPFVEKLSSYFTSLYLNSSDQDYLARFIPIRTNNLFLDLELESTNSKIYDKVYDNFNITLSSEPTIVKFKSFHLADNLGFIKGNAILDASNFQPSFCLNITDGMQQSTNLGQLLLGINKIAKHLPDLNLVSISSNIKLQELLIGNMPLHDLHLKISSNKNTLTLEALEFKGCQGKAQINGHITANPFSTSLAYAYNNINLEQMLQDSIGPQGASGFISTSGIANFNGDSLEQMLYSLEINGKILAQNVMIDNLSIDDLSQKQLNQNLDLNDYSSSGQTECNNIQSDLSIKRGNIKLENITLDTRNTTAKGSAQIDLYQLAINAQLLFDLQGKSRPNYQNPLQLELKISQHLFNPVKVLRIVDPLATNK